MTKSGVLPTSSTTLKTPLVFVTIRTHASSLPTMHGTAVALDHTCRQTVEPGQPCVVEQLRLGPSPGSCPPRSSRSARSRARCRRCGASPVPSCARSARAAGPSRSGSARPSRVRPSHGSSSTSTGGSLTSARAMSALRASPVESVFMRRSASARGRNGDELSARRSERRSVLLRRHADRAEEPREDRVPHRDRRSCVLDAATPHREASGPRRAPSAPRRTT